MPAPEAGRSAPASRPRVSVIVRTKNRPLMLRRALHDIFAQSFLDSNVIVVNDGGDLEAASAVIAEVPAEHRARIRRIDHAESQGRWAAANAGVRAAVGDYLVLHDDDDLWHPDFLTTTVAVLDAAPGEVAVAARTEIVYERLDEHGAVHRLGTTPFCPEVDSITLPNMLRSNQIVPIGFVYRRALHDEIGLYDPSLAVVGDWEFNLRVLAHHRIAFLSEPALAYWCQRLDESGEQGNSVHTARVDHAVYDAQVRDDHLRAALGAGGWGGALHLAKEAQRIEQRIVAQTDHLDALDLRLSEMMQRLDSIERLIVDRTSVWNTVRRAVPARRRREGGQAEL